ncbi:succinylglutamate desuccinylase / aspartoacylase family [Legionella beliardensis]|uniref:Succinylglutamate desuccinylase / aspartoacylase family n=1 Tax=Legionella beliardensis TaxID=91822 RepID=A0A378I4P4_9GAMM|nr:succinylglutamate desuccinylase/aspartoacylase family protein [Legionella beliardensis]STX29666.1 succinylglutamate desuccinylase / aspartoacylase family [Legionella beliardensis]
MTQLKKNTSLTLCNVSIKPGQNHTILCDFSNFYTSRRIKVPIHIFHGQHTGPKLFILSTLHGDEVNGIEIINRLHEHKAVKHLNGTLITIPVANPFGLILRTREAIGQDLNRVFPGNKTGKLASRLAYFLTENIIKQCDYGIDLHSGGNYLFNLPQTRIDESMTELCQLAEAFGVAIIDSPVRKKSLRGLTMSLNIPLLVFEGGEASRVDDGCIKVGLQGVLNVLANLNMIDAKWAKKKTNPVYYRELTWIRAPAGGLLLPHQSINHHIKKNQVLAKILDPFDLESAKQVRSPCNGTIIAKSTAPLVNEGEPLFHIAPDSKK